MSYRKSRKRRRSEAFLKDAQDEDRRLKAALEDNDAQGEKDEDQREGEEMDAAQKEHEIWDAFREEQYESMSIRITLYIIA